MLTRNLGEQIQVHTIGVADQLTTATPYVTAAIDTTSKNGGQLVIPVSATLTSGATCKIKASISDISDNYTAYTVINPSGTYDLVATGASGGSTVNASLKFLMNFEKYQRTIKIKLESQLSTATDTFKTIPLINFTNLEYGLPDLTKVE